MNELTSGPGVYQTLLKLDTTVLLWAAKVPGTLHQREGACGRWGRWGLASHP